MVSTSVARLLSGLCLIALTVSPVHARDFRLSSNKAPATIEEALHDIKRELGKRSVEEYNDGEIIVFELDKVPKRASNHSGSGSRLLMYLTTSCAQEFGGMRRDDNGRLQRDGNYHASGSTHFTSLVTAAGDRFSQNFRPLFEDVVSTTLVASKRSFAVRPGDVSLQGGYLKTDIASLCLERSDSDDQGERLVFVASSKYFDPKSSRYLLILLRGQTMHDLLAQARIDKVEFAATYAAQQKELKRQKEAERQARASEREAELSAEYERTEQFQLQLAVGQQTQCGLVIEVKQPVAQVQTAVGVHWFRVEELHPAGTGRCPKDVDPRTSQERLQACETKIHECQNSCNRQYPDSTVAKPHIGWTLCRGLCREDACQ